jgi:hypothetical protein
MRPRYSTILVMASSSRNCVVAKTLTSFPKQRIFFVGHLELIFWNFRKRNDSSELVPKSLLFSQGPGAKNNNKTKQKQKEIPQNRGLSQGLKETRRRREEQEREKRKKGPLKNDPGNKHELGRLVPWSGPWSHCTGRIWCRLTLVLCFS